MNKHPLQHLMDRPEPSDLFLEARQVAGVHLQEQFQRYHSVPRRDGFTWIKAELTYPSFDHLTFGFKNSIFSVLIELIDASGSSLTDHQLTRWTDACTANNLIPCLFKINCLAMKDGFDLSLLHDAWNLVGLHNPEPIDPMTIASEEPFGMSAWELRNFSIQVVREYLAEKGHEVLSFCDLPEVNPQIWFRDAEGKMNWVIVQYSTDKEVPIADAWMGFEQSNEQLLPYAGYFAGVQISSDQATLLRGGGMFVNFRGLIPITS